MARGGRGASRENIDVFDLFQRRATERFSTGIYILDLLLRGGIPKGDYVELCSDTGLGKSTICLQITKRYAKLLGWVLILDFEQGFTDELLKSMNCDDLEKEGLIKILQPITFGDGERILDNLDQSNPPSLVIVDSITAMLPDKIEEKREDSRGSLKDGKKPGMQLGLKARCEAEFLLKYKGWARKNGITFVFINQKRTKFTRQFVAYEDSAGGNAFKFYADIRLFMRKIVELKQKENTPQGEQEIPCGNTIEVVAKKNRGNRSYIPVEMDVYFGKGVSNLKSLANSLLKSGLIVQSGSFFKLDGLGFNENVRGWVGLMAFVKENKDMLKEKVSELITMSLVQEGGTDAGPESDQSPQ